MPAWLLREWQEYERLEPFGAWRDNWHMAVIASVLANIHRDPKRAPINPDRFFYTDPQTARERADVELLARFEALADGR